MWPRRARGARTGTVSSGLRERYHSGLAAGERRVAAKGSRKKGKDGADQPVDLEKALAELETLVDELESGDLPLEKALEQFERGVALTRDCEAALTAAERKVALLMSDAGIEDTARPFDDAAEDTDD